MDVQGFSSDNRVRTARVDTERRNTGLSLAE